MVWKMWPLAALLFAAVAGCLGSDETALTAVGLVEETLDERAMGDATDTVVYEIRSSKFPDVKETTLHFSQPTPDLDGWDRVVPLVQVTSPEFTYTYERDGEDVTATSSRFLDAASGTSIKVLLHVGDESATYYNDLSAADSPAIWNAGAAVSQTPLDTWHPLWSWSTEDGSLPQWRLVEEGSAGHCTVYRFEYSFIDDWIPRYCVAPGELTATWRSFEHGTDWWLAQRITGDARYGTDPVALGPRPAAPMLGTEGWMPIDHPLLDLAVPPGDHAVATTFRDMAATTAAGPEEMTGPWRLQAGHYAAQMENAGASQAIPNGYTRWSNGDQGFYVFMNKVEGTWLPASMAHPSDLGAWKEFMPESFVLTSPPLASANIEDGFYASIIPLQWNEDQREHHMPERHRATVTFGDVCEVGWSETISLTTGERIDRQEGRHDWCDLYEQDGSLDLLPDPPRLHAGPMVPGLVARGPETPS